MTRREFKEGCVDGIAMYGAAALTLGGAVILVVILIGLQLYLWIGALCGLHHATLNAVKAANLSPILVMICDTYVHWYDKITNVMNKLVK